MSSIISREELVVGRLIKCRYRIHEDNASHKLAELGLQESLWILSQIYAMSDLAAADGIRKVRAQYVCWDFTTPQGSLRLSATAQKRNGGILPNVMGSINQA